MARKLEARLPLLDNVADWTIWAACKAEPDLFFHPDGERGVSRRERQAAAKAICAACIVRDECLDHSLRAREPYGTWGGVTEEERARYLASSAAAGQAASDVEAV